LCWLFCTRVVGSRKFGDRLRAWAIVVAEALGNTPVLRAPRRAVCPFARNGCNSDPFDLCQRKDSRFDRQCSRQARQTALSGISAFGPALRPNPEGSWRIIARAPTLTPPLPNDARFLTRNLCPRVSPFPPRPRLRDSSPAPASRGVQTQESETSHPCAPAGIDGQMPSSSLSPAP